MPTLFDIPPKRDPKFLFGRDKELADLVKNIREKRWTILLGPRRVGKTSLAKCAIEKAGCDSVVVDARENANFADNLFAALTRANSSVKVGAKVNFPAGLPVVSLRTDYSRQVLTQSLDSILTRRGKLAILLDEAQWFRDRRTLIMLLAHIYDYHYEEVTLIITGSAVGVMKSLLEPSKTSPMFGRPLMQMEVKKWTHSTSMSFLTEGLKQNKVSLSTDFVAKTVDALDGLPGWLTIFGYYFTASPSDYEKALTKTLTEAFKVVDDETSNIGKIAKGWASHAKILKLIASGSSSFTELLDGTGQTNSLLSKQLAMLQRLNYVEKRADGRYEIIDPVLAELTRRRTKNQ